VHQFCSVPTYGYVNTQRYGNKEDEKLNPPAWLYDDYLYQEYYCTYYTIHVLIPFNATFDLTHIKEYTVHLKKHTLSFSQFNTSCLISFRRASRTAILVTARHASLER